MRNGCQNDTHMPYIDGLKFWLNNSGRGGCRGVHQILLKIKRQRKKLGREVPRVRSQLKMRDETQPTSCGLCFNTNSYVKIVKFLRSRFFVYFSIQKIFHRSIRQNRRRPWYPTASYGAADVLLVIQVPILSSLTSWLSAHVPTLSVGVRQGH